MRAAVGESSTELYCTVARAATAHSPESPIQGQESDAGLRHVADEVKKQSEHASRG